MSQPQILLSSAKGDLRTEPRLVRGIIIAIAVIFLTVFVVLPLVVGVPVVVSLVGLPVVVSASVVPPLLEPSVVVALLSPQAATADASKLRVR